MTPKLDSQFHEITTAEQLLAIMYAELADRDAKIAGLESRLRKLEAMAYGTGGQIHTQRQNQINGQHGEGA
jgi:hypothetical protein